MQKNWKTDVIAYAKLAAAAFYGYLVLKSGRPLDDRDYMIFTMLGLGAAGSKVSADAPPKDPQA